MRTCEHCRDYLYPQGDTKAYYCSGCKVVSYCSKRCQTGDWGKHKKDCVRLKEESQAHRLPYRQVYGRGGPNPSDPDKPVRCQCGLCGSRKPPFEVTDCCGRVVCSDRDNYVLMSYGRNSCARNHDCYSACSTHHNEGHAGPWKECSRCKFNCDPYDWWTFGSNPESMPSRSNFPDDVVEGPRPPLPRCARCSRGVDTSCEAHSYGGDGLRCAACVML